MQWINNSIMALNAVAKGLAGVKHRLSEEDQGRIPLCLRPLCQTCDADNPRGCG